MSIQCEYCKTNFHRETNPSEILYKYVIIEVRFDIEKIYLVFCSRWCQVQYLLDQEKKEIQEEADQKGND